jgi:hypothetical protein
LILEPHSEGKLQRSSKLLFIFPEPFRNPFVTAAETASRSSPGTKVDPHKVEGAEEGLLLGESTEYTASQAHRPTPVPRRILRFHRQQPEQSSDFHQRSSSSRLTGPTTSSPEDDDDVSTLDSCAGLPNLSTDVGVDYHRRTEEAGRNYSVVPPSLPHRVGRKSKLQMSVLLRQSLTPLPRIDNEQTLP